MKQQFAEKNPILTFFLCYVKCWQRTKNEYRVDSLIFSHRLPQRAISGWSEQLKSALREINPFAAWKGSFLLRKSERFTICWSLNKQLCEGLSVNNIPVTFKRTFFCCFVDNKKSLIASTQIVVMIRTSKRTLLTLKLKPKVLWLPDVTSYRTPPRLGMSNRCRASTASHNKACNNIKLSFENRLAANIPDRLRSRRNGCAVGVKIRKSPKSKNELREAFQRSWFTDGFRAKRFLLNDFTRTAFKISSVVCW